MKFVALAIIVLAGMVLFVGIRATTHHPRRKCGNVFGTSCTATNPFG
jgi:hypothetical protein